MAAKAGSSTAAAAASLPNVDVPSNNIRFQIELEFIQCLASPSYLNCASWLAILPIRQCEGC